MSLALLLAACATPSASASTELEPSPTLASAPTAEPEPEPERPPVLGLELGLPPRPDFHFAELPTLLDDETWSVHGLLAYREQMLPEAKDDRVVQISAYVQEVYELQQCPEDEPCPPPKQPHAWVVDLPDIEGRALMLMVVGTEFPIPEWDTDTSLAWADQPRVVLEPGRRYVFMGWFRRFTDSGFAHDHGLLELFALTEAPLGPESRWIAPPNSPHHPRNREASGRPSQPERATMPQGLNPGAPVPPRVSLVDPGDPKLALELGREAEAYDQPYLVDYYYRWLIVDQPNSPAGWVCLANAYLGYGESEAGEALLELALERMPNDPELHNGRGRFFLEGGRVDEAISAYQRGLEQTPDAADMLFGLGLAYAQNAQPSESVEALERFLEVSGGSPEHVIRAARDVLARMQYEATR